MNEWKPEELRELKRLWPKAKKAEIEKAFPGRAYTAIMKKASSLRIKRAGAPIAVRPIPPSHNIRGLTKKDILLKHDNTFKIQECVKKLKRDEFLPDQEMRALCNVSPNVWRAYSEKPEFDKYKVRPNSRDLYWATPKDAKDMKEQLGLTTY